MASITIQRNGRLLKLGELRKGIFRKEVKQSKHLFKKLDAWGFDLKAFEEVIKPQASEIRIREKESKSIYSTTPTTIKEKGIILNFKPHGVQVFLPRKYWSVNNKPPKENGTKNLFAE